MGSTSLWPTRPVVLISLLTMLAGMGGCVGDDVAPTGPTGRATASPPAAVGLQAESAAKAQAFGPQPRRSVAPVDWQAAHAFTSLAMALPKAATQRLGTIDLPVLLPASAELLSTLVLTSGNNWYAASMRGADYGVSLHATRVRFSRPQQAPPATPTVGKLAKELTVDREELIAGVSFNRFGVAYRLEVDCARPSTDPRCNKDDFILGLVGALRFAGGSAEASQ